MKQNPRWWVHYEHPERGEVQVPFATLEGARDYVKELDKEGWTLLSFYSDNPLVKGEPR